MFGNSMEKPVDVLSDGTFCDLAYKYALLQSFFQYIYEIHPELCKEFFDREKQNDELLTKFRGECHAN